MARPESRMDLMHVPTPTVVCDSLASALAIGENTRCLDPCCGTGQALSELARLSRHRYGVEIEVGRALMAMERLERVLAASLLMTRMSRRAFGLMLLNPPYDDSADGRLEAVFLNRCGRQLADDGVLVYIIKESRYSAEIVREIAKNYDTISHWRFPAGWYDGPELAYQQTVLIARRRKIARDEIDIEQWRGTWLQNLEPIPAAGEWSTEPLQVPDGSTPQLFAAHEIPPEQLENMARNSGLSLDMDLPGFRGNARAPLPLRRGHTALMLSSGLLDGLVGQPGDADYHLAKGTIIRSRSRTEEVERDSHGNQTTIVREREGFAIKIRAMTADATIYDVAGAPAIIEDEEEEA